MYITPCFEKIFKFMVLRLLTNAFVIQNIESIHFHLCSQATLLSGRMKLKISLWQYFLKFHFHSAERGGDYRAVKMTKIKLVRVLATPALHPSLFFISFLYIFYFCFCCAIIKIQAC